MIISNKQQQQAKNGHRHCLYLATLWLITVLGLLHFSLRELRTLRAQRELWNAKYGTTVGGGEYTIKTSFEISGSAPAAAAASSDGNLTPQQQSDNTNASSLLEVLRDAANDGITQISMAVKTGLTDSPADPSEASTEGKKGHLILHVGPSKTGRSAQQARFFSLPALVARKTRIQPTRPSLSFADSDHDVADRSDDSL